MNAIQNFAFEEHLVRAVEQNGEPWFVGKDVCNVLGVIKHHQALERLDNDERGTCIVGTPSGDQTMIVVSEAGVFRLIFSSRKPEAERFKRWLAHEVLPQIRRTGKYDPGNTPRPPDEILPTDQRAALQLVTEARMLYGKARARLLWESLPNLPQVPPLPQIAADDERDGFACLGYMLQKPSSGEVIVREIVEEAFEETEEAHRMLREIGIRVVTDQTLGAGVVVATSADQVRKLFWGTKWAAGNHAAALRSLPGAVRYKTMKFAENRASSSIFIPVSLLSPQG